MLNPESERTPVQNLTGRWPWTSRSVEAESLTTRVQQNLMDYRTQKRPVGETRTQNRRLTLKPRVPIRIEVLGSTSSLSQRLQGGGIIIPDTAKEKPMEGEVVAVGPGARAEDGKIHPLDVKAGDRILFGKWSGTEIKLDGEDLLIMKESDVMGVIEKPVRSGRKAA
jgi:chaperonin GroES